MDRLLIHQLFIIKSPYIATVMCGFASTDAFGQHLDLIW